VYGHVLEVAQAEAARKIQSILAAASATATAGGER
jgi:hypothetical protein